MDKLTVAHHAMFADLMQQCRDASFDEQFPENGSFVQQRHGSNSYWYYIGSNGTTEGRRTKYVGSVSNPDITRRVEEFKRSKVGFNERRQLVRSLASVLPTPIPIVGNIVEAVWKAGLFRLRGVMIGTVAYQTYAGLLGVKLPSTSIMTGDVDFAQDRATSVMVNDTMPPMLETFRAIDKTFRDAPTLKGSGTSFAFINETGFKIEFLTTNRGSDDNTGKPTRMPALGGTSALPLRFMDYLIYEPTQSVLLHKGGVPVTVPTPERYAVHKIIVSQRRRDDGGKSIKDILQAGLLIEALTVSSKAFDLGQAWSEAWDRGPKWRQALTDGKRRLQIEHRQMLDSAIAEVQDAETNGGKSKLLQSARARQTSLSKAYRTRRKKARKSAQS